MEMLKLNKTIDSFCNQIYSTLSVYKHKQITMPLKLGYNALSYPYNI